jgi:hypothetical protein
MAERFKVVDGSESAHCCFVATVVNDDFEEICECFERADAERIAAALNAASGVQEGGE